MTSLRKYCISQAESEIISLIEKWDQINDLIESIEDYSSRDEDINLLGAYRALISGMIGDILSKMETNGVLSMEDWITVNRIVAYMGTGIPMEDILA